MKRPQKEALGKNFLILGKSNTLTIPSIIKKDCRRIQELLWILIQVNKEALKRLSQRPSAYNPKYNIQCKAGVVLLTLLHSCQNTIFHLSDFSYCLHNLIHFIIYLQ